MPRGYYTANHKYHVPSQQEIAEQCAAFQATWSKAEEYARRTSRVEIRPCKIADDGFRPVIMLGVFPRESDGVDLGQPVTPGE